MQYVRADRGCRGIHAINSRSGPPGEGGRRTDRGINAGDQAGVGCIAAAQSWVGRA
jgi:hypothetical protein